MRSFSSLLKIGSTITCLAALMGCNVLTGGDDVVLVGGGDEPAVGNGGGVVPAAPGPEALMSCAYSPSNPGVALNMQIPASKQWDGYRPFSHEIGTGYGTEHYDCTGNKGVHAIVFETSQFN